MARETPEKPDPVEKAVDKSDAGGQAGQLDRRNVLKGAAGVGLGAMALGTAAASGATAGASGEGACPATIQDLVTQMAGDPIFAAEVIRAPEAYQDEYALSNRAVQTLRGLRLEDFEHLSVADAKGFAAGAITAASMARHDFAPAADCGDTCYYFG